MVLSLIEEDEDEVNPAVATVDATEERPRKAAIVKIRDRSSLALSSSPPLPSLFVSHDLIERLRI